MGWKDSLDVSHYNITTDLKLANRVLVFDTHNLIHKCIKAKHYKVLSHNGLPTGHLHGTLQCIYSAIRNYTSLEDKIALVFTIEAESTRKKQLFNGYKANREHKENDKLTMEELLRQNTSSDDMTKEMNNLVNDKRDTEKLQVEEAYRTIKLLPTIWINKLEEEADDVISSFCEKHLDKKITILTSDKDMWQLLNMPNVSIYSSVHKGFINDDLIEKNFGVTTKTAYLIPLIKALYGDHSDNIPQVPFRLSKDMIMQYVKQSDGTVQSFLQNIIKNPPEDAEISKKLLLALNKFKEQIMMFWSITYLSRNIDINMIPQEGNKEEILSILRKYKLNQALDWIHAIM